MQWSQSIFIFFRFSQLLAGESAKCFLDFSRLLVAADTLDESDFIDPEINREHDTDDRKRGWVLIQADQTFLHCISDFQLPLHLMQVHSPFGATNEKRRFFSIFFFRVEMLKSQLEWRFDKKQPIEIDIIGVHESVDLLEVDCLSEIFLPI